MPSSRPAIVVLLALLAAACATRRPAQPPELSGFLDDYRLLRRGGPSELDYVYRDEHADWRSYDAVLLEPVTIWRSGRRALEPVPETDLLRLAADFEHALRTRLGEDFRLAASAGPRVLRIRMALTEARAADPVLDVLTAEPGAVPAGAGDDPLDPETRRFVERAAIEGELRDGATNALLAAGVELPKEGRRSITTWGDVDRALARWVDQVAGRLEQRTRRH